MTLTYAILVMGPADTDSSSALALRFCREVLRQGHRIRCIFFLGDGVQNASLLARPPQDETAMAAQWSALYQSSKVELFACVSSALRRGIVDAAEAERYDLPAHNLHPDFQIAGLGQWVDACIESDRVIRFGGQ